MDKELKRIINNIKSQNNLKAYYKKQREIEEFEKEQRRRQLKERLESCGMTLQMYENAKKFKYWKFYYVNKEGGVRNSALQYKAVANWWKHLKHDYPFLILYGEKGTGKTKLAQRVAYRGFEDFKSVYYSDRKKLDLKLYDFENLEEFIHFLQEVRLLIIDDFFTGYQTDYKFAQLYSVLDYRYQKNKWTVITMNEDIRKIRNKELTQGVEKDLILLADRLLEKGIFVHFDYPSLRDPKLKEAAQKGDIRHLQRIENKTFDMEV